MKEKNKTKEIPLDIFTNKNRFIRLTLTISLLVSGLGVFIAAITRIDEVIIAPGELKVMGKDVSIKSPYDGNLINVYVDEGDFVNKGDYLIKMDDSINKIELKTLKERLSNLQDNYLMQLKIIEKLELLFSEGAIPEISLLKEQKELKNINLDIKIIEGKINQQTIVLSKSNIKSPTNGTVSSVNVTDNGYKTLKGEELLKIIPDNKLEAKLLITNRDIGFIKEDMDVKIKLDSHPYTQFGYLKGIVKSIGPMTIAENNVTSPSQTRYPVYVLLNNQYLEKKGKKFSFRSGQSISGSFKVRDKPFITIFSEIFDKVGDSITSILSKKSLFLQNKTQ